MRGEPVPVFPQASPGAHSFTRKSATEAIETLRLSSGDMLRLEHGGCEYYVLTIDVPAPASGLASKAYVATANRLDELQAMQADANFDLSRASRTLRAMAARGAPLGEEAEIEGDGEDFLQARLSLVREKGKLRLSLFRGPL